MRPVAARGEARGEVRGEARGEIEIACGIDVGFSATAATSAISAFAVERRGARARISVARETRVLTSSALDLLVSGREAPLDDDRVRLVTLDAAVTLTEHLAMPS